jgi:hypothetical protein
MYTAALASAFEAVVVISTASAIAASVLILRSRLPAARTAGRASLLFHPLAQFLFVCALVFANQILCHAYVLRVHGGSAAFVTRYLGPGWFASASGWSIVRFVASHIGNGRWLAPTVLRVQAFLELPFTIFAYLAVARLLGQDVQRRLVRLPLLIGASVSFSITFSLVEMSLPNPWTNDDLVLRALAAVVTPPWVLLATRLEGARDEERPSGVVGLFSFFAGAGAISYVVLACYDALLIYNLGHLPRYAQGIAIAIVVAATASWAAPRIDRLLARRLELARSRAVDAIASALVFFTVVFFVPSLALRYWGGHASALLAGLLLVSGSAFAGIAAAARRGDAWSGMRLVVGATIGVVVGVFAATLAVTTTSFALPELVLARASLAFLAAGTFAFRAFEVCCGPHEAKAQADEA